MQCPWAGHDDSRNDLARAGLIVAWQSEERQRVFLRYYENIRTTRTEEYEAMELVTLA